jgi:hypothetical protein
MKNPNAPDAAHHQKSASFNLVKTAETAPDNFSLYKLAFWVHHSHTEDIVMELRRIADSMEDSSGAEKQVSV